MKQEVETGYRTLCSTCLSSDRNLISVNCNEQVHQVFRILMSDFEAERFEERISDTEQLICWECLALMRRFGRFKQQVHSAQEHLRIMETQDSEDLSHSLSALEVVTRVDYDKIFFDYSTRDQGLLTEEESAQSVHYECNRQIFLDSSEMPQLVVSSEDPLLTPTASFACQSEPKIPVSPITANKLRTAIVQAKPDEDVKKVGYITTYMSEEQMLAAREEDKQRVQYASSPYKCALCVMGFRTQDEVEVHDSMHRPTEGCVACRVCSVYMPEASLRTHEASHYYRHTCNECGHGSYSARAMGSHVKSHAGFECKKCSKSFKRKSRLQEHIEYHHTEKYKHVCQECDKHFVRKSILNEHIHKMHSDIKPDMPKKHICEICSRAFIRRQHLVQHVHSHTGARPHACALCAVRFAQESPLVTHLRGVHGKAGGFRELLKKYMKA